MSKEFLIKCIREAAEELGYRSMKPKQLQVVLKFVEGSDVFAVLPTGFGKSLSYACLPLAFDSILNSKRGHSIVVVVTPLLAIMTDQVRCSFPVLWRYRILNAVGGNFRY